MKDETSPVSNAQVLKLLIILRELADASGEQREEAVQNALTKLESYPTADLPRLRRYISELLGSTDQEVTEHALVRAFVESALLGSGELSDLDDANLRPEVREHLQTCTACRALVEQAREPQAPWEREAIVDELKRTYRAWMGPRFAQWSSFAASRQTLAGFRRADVSEAQQQAVSPDTVFSLADPDTGLDLELRRRPVLGQEGSNKYVLEVQLRNAALGIVYEGTWNLTVRLRGQDLRGGFENAVWQADELLSEQDFADLTFDYQLQMEG